MKTFIIHVSDAYERESHMLKQLEGKKLDHSFMNEGDKKDLTQEVLDTYFTGRMASQTGQTSCAYKHLLVYKAMVEKQIDYALVLEDDIILYDNFSAYLPKFMQEVASRKLENLMIFVEESTLKYVKGSEKVKGQHLYAKGGSRTMGIYIIDRKAAASIMQQALSLKCDEPIDWFVSHCCARGAINIYWSTPVLAVQGSLTGMASSMIDHKPVSIFRRISFGLQRIYKRMLYSLR